MRHSTTNYRMIEPLVKACDNNDGYIKLESAGYMDLSLDNLQYSDHDGLPVYSMAHYGVQNGDAMADPDMTFAVDFEKKRIIPRSFQNDYMHVYHEVFVERDGKTLYSPSLLNDLDDFLWQWLKNIEEQGFKDAIKTA